MLLLSLTFMSLNLWMLSGLHLGTPSCKCENELLKLCVHAFVLLRKGRLDGECSGKYSLILENDNV